MTPAFRVIAKNIAVWCSTAEVFDSFFFFCCRASDITGRTSEPRGQEGKGIESGSLFVSLASSDMRRF